MKHVDWLRSWLPYRFVAGDKPLIGWRERVDLPGWGLHGVPAKIDTGARSSAIDVDHIEELGDDRVRFEVVAKRSKDDETAGVRRVLEAAIVRRSRVRSSLGADHDRLFVRARIDLAGRQVETEIGLVSRESMISRMLLGRRCLDGVFIVDAGRRYLHGKRPLEEVDMADMVNIDERYGL